MIDPKNRFDYSVAAGGRNAEGHSDSWYVFDSDQRRWVAVFHQDVKTGYGRIAADRLRPHMDSLDPSVTAVYTSPNNEVLVTKTEYDAHTPWCRYPTLDEVEEKLSRSLPTILRSELRELDRLGPLVDLVSYVGPHRSQSEADSGLSNCVASKSIQVAHTQVATGPQQAVFKYEAAKFGFGLKEPQILLRLEGHPNIVPFEKLVVDEDYRRVVGFTSRYIPGGTFDKNITRTFKLKWLKQLMAVVDDLNLEHGIMHQDIGTHNLLVDQTTDDILVFDFNASITSSPAVHRSVMACLDDVSCIVFAVYEIITQDKHFRERRAEFMHTSSAVVEELGEWVKHPDVKLDHEVHEYRSAVQAWAAKRREDEPFGLPLKPNCFQVVEFYDPRERFEWTSTDDAKAEIAESRYEYGEARNWSMARELGEPVIDWVRPPQSQLKEGDILLANGKVLGKDELPKDQ